MRYAVISDIHSNQEALKGVLGHIQKRGIKTILCLGDIVGYGPEPLECLELIMQTCEVCLKGNHDEAIVEGVCFFNPAARKAIEWTSECLIKTDSPQREKIWRFLEELPLSYSLDNYLFVHGSPLDPTSDYILARDIPIEGKKFQEIFASFDNILFVGHTHMPCIITESSQFLSLESLGYKYKAGKEKAIVNVGSVGQPRDQDPRACYLEVIDDFFFFHRIAYDHNKVCQSILDNPYLNDNLGKRLLTGS